MMTDTKRSAAIERNLIITRKRIVMYEYTLDQLLSMDSILTAMFPTATKLTNKTDYDDMRWVMATIFADFIKITHQKTAFDEETMCGMEQLMNAINAIKNTPLPPDTFLSPVVGSC